MKLKSLLQVMALAVCTSLSAGAVAALNFDATTGFLTDTEAGRMWAFHGIGFGSSYGFPGFANAWVADLNQLAVGGYADWALPTIDAPSDGSPPPGGSGDLGRLYLNLSATVPDRSQWPFGLGATDYGGRIIFTDRPVPSTPDFWGLNFGNGAYVPVYPGNAYAYVGVMAVRPVPEPETWAMLLMGLGLGAARVITLKRRSGAANSGAGRP